MSKNVLIKKIITHKQFFFHFILKIRKQKNSKTTLTSQNASFYFQNVTGIFHDIAVDVAKHCYQVSDPPVSVVNDSESFEWTIAEPQFTGKAGEK